MDEAGDGAATEGAEDTGVDGGFTLRAGAVGAGVRNVAGGALPAGGSGLGAETPAISDPNPIFCRLGASSFPLGSRPFAD